MPSRVCIALHCGAPPSDLSLPSRRHSPPLPRSQIPATPDAQRTALLLAASTRKYEAVAHLLHHGAKPNQSEMEQRRTALHIAADAKDVRMMLQLASTIEVVVTRKDSVSSLDYSVPSQPRSVCSAHRISSQHHYAMLGPLCITRHRRATAPS